MRREEYSGSLPHLQLRIRIDVLKSLLKMCKIALKGGVHSTDCGLVLEALGQRCVPDTHPEEEMAHKATQCTSWGCSSTL